MWISESLNSVLNVKAVVAAFNQEKALVGAFSVVVQLHRLIVYSTGQQCHGLIALGSKVCWDDHILCTGWTMFYCYWPLLFSGNTSKVIFREHNILISLFIIISLAFRTDLKMPFYPESEKGDWIFQNLPSAGSHWPSFSLLDPRSEVSVMHRYQIAVLEFWSNSRLQFYGGCWNCWMVL